MNMTPNPGAGLSNAPYVIGNYAPVAGESGVVNVAYPIGDARRYGATGVAATDASNAFANADATAVAGASGATVVSPGTHRIAVNLTLSGAIKPRGGVIKPDNGVTVTIAGAVTAGASQWIDLSAGGKVLFSRRSARITAEWFGADPTGVADSTAALQAAIDTALASNVTLGAILTIVLSGKYKTTNALRGFYWNAGAFSFATFHMEGARGYIGGAQVEICPTFTDRPALILQAARSVEIRGINFTGALPLVFPTGIQCLKDTGGAAGSPWYNSGNVGRDSRYSPYCAVAIDPFSNGVPADGGIPGHSAYYTQNVGSSGVTVERSMVRAFIVAWATGISNGSQQCDNLMFRDCNVENVKVVFAAGQTQNRNTTMENVFALYVRSMIDTRSYGIGNGQCPNVFGGAVAGACKWLLVSGAGFGSATIKGFYAESIWSLGQWVGGFPLTFDDCHFAMNPPGSGGNCTSHLDSGSPVIFRGGFFGYFNNVYGRLSLNCVNGVVFDAVQLTGEPVMPRYATSEFRGAKLRFSGLGNTYGINHTFRDLFTTFNPAAEPILAPNGAVEESFNSTDFRRLRWREYISTLSIDGAAVVTVNADNTATFTSVGAVKLQVGDVLTILVPTANFTVEKFIATDATVNAGSIAIGTVQSIVGNNVTLQDCPNGFGSGTYNVAIVRLPRFKPRTIGVTTSGSNVITSVSPSPSMWRVGDRINGTNIPAGTYVTARDAVANTITLSQNATATGANSEAYDVKMIADEAFGAAKPTYEVWFAGDFVQNVAGTKDGNNLIIEGWRCTVSGRGDGTAPAATFETIYSKTTTP